MSLSFPPSRRLVFHSLNLPHTPISNPRHLISGTKHLSSWQQQYALLLQHPATSNAYAIRPIPSYTQSTRASQPSFPTVARQGRWVITTCTARSLDRMAALSNASSTARQYISTTSLPNSLIRVHGRTNCFSRTWTITSSGTCSSLRVGKAQQWKPAGTPHSQHTCRSRAKPLPHGGVMHAVTSAFALFSFPGRALYITHVNSTA